MLHFVEISHTPESCPGRPENQETVIPCVNKMQELLSERGIKSVGSWADPPGHVNYMVLDAASSHDLQQVIMDSGLSAYTNSSITPVVSLQEDND